MGAEDPKGSLLAQARARQEGKRAVRCTIGKILAAHPDLAAEMNELMDAASDDNDDLTYASAALTLSAAVNDKVDGQTISRHQRGRCACS